LKRLVRRRESPYFASDSASEVMEEEEGEIEEEEEEDDDEPEEEERGEGEGEGERPTETPGNDSSSSFDIVTELAFGATEEVIWIFIGLFFYFV